MSIVWIGAGNLAASLAPALRRAGHDIVQVFSRTRESAAGLAAVLDCPFTTDVAAVRADAEVYLFAVNDAALDGLAGQIAPRVGEALCIHTAGSLPLDVFRGRARRYGVFYPMQTFSRACPVDFSGIPCFVEGVDAAACAQVEQLARSVSGHVMALSSDRRRHLHLAAVFACNFVNHCYALAADVLQAQDIPFDVMLPLVDETARKVHSLPPAAAQTGPAVRGDRNVTDMHLALLAGRPELREVYELMSRSIRRRARQEKDKTGNNI